MKHKSLTILKFKADQNAPKKKKKRTLVAFLSYKTIKKMQRKTQNTILTILLKLTRNVLKKRKRKKL
jgi:hypothetical protein